jgi:Protein of unknown function (DUF4031)
MANYVGKKENQSGRMKSCHVIADAIAELHEMADRIGLQREWFRPLFDSALRSVQGTPGRRYQSGRDRS